MKWDAALYDEVKVPQFEAGWELVRMAEVRPADSILDLGCGTGSLTAVLASPAPAGRVVGMDASAEMLEEAGKRAEAVENMETVLLPAESMGFREEFDLVFSNSALQWIREQEKVLALVYRALKPAGRIAFQLVARDFCPEFLCYTAEAIDALHIGRFFDGWETPWFQPTKEEYEMLLEKTGFASVEVSCRDSTMLFEGMNEAVGWFSATALRPFLARLPQAEQGRFVYAVAMRFENHRTGRGIEFSLKRLFARARKGG